MPFEPRIAEAQLVLDRISTVEMPRLAWGAMEAGLDGLAIPWLAALELFSSSRNTARSNERNAFRNHGQNGSGSSPSEDSRAPDTCL